MKTYSLVALFVFAFVAGALAQTQEEKNAQISWISYQKALKEFEEKPKHIFVYLYKKDDSESLRIDSVFAQKEVADYVNYVFYPVKIEAQSPDRKFLDQIVFADQAKDQRQYEYPTLVVLTTDGTGAYYTGYRDRDHLFPILIYFREYIYRTNTDFETFEKNYYKAYPPNNQRGFTVTRSIVKWKTLKEAQQYNQRVGEKGAKKIFVDLYANWQTASTIQYIATYNHPTIAQILNNRFTPVEIRVTTRDSIFFNGKTYINQGQPNRQTYHDIVPFLMKNKLSFPAFVIIDEKGEIIFTHRAYATPQRIEPMLMYYATDAYKTMTEQEFLKTFESKIQEKEAQ